MKTLAELQREITERLAHDEEGRQRREAAHARKAAALREFAVKEPETRTHQQRSAAEATAAKAVWEGKHRIAVSAWSALQGLSEWKDREVLGAEAELRETAPAQYDGLRDWLAKAFDQARHSRHKNGAARMKAIRVAQKRLDELALDPSQDAKADEHVRRIQQSIPPMET